MSGGAHRLLSVPRFALRRDEAAASPDYAGPALLPGEYAARRARTVADGWPPLKQITRRHSVVGGLSHGDAAEPHLTRASG
jgi:hypothetical protein